MTEFKAPLRLKAAINRQAFYKARQEHTAANAKTTEFVRVLNGGGAKN